MMAGPDTLAPMRAYVGRRMNTSIIPSADEIIDVSRPVCGSGVLYMTVIAHGNEIGALL